MRTTPLCLRCAHAVDNRRGAGRSEMPPQTAKIVVDLRRPSRAKHESGRIIKHTPDLCIERFSASDLLLRLEKRRRCRARLSRPRAARDPPVRRLRADSFPSNRQAPCSALGPFSEHSVWIGAGHIGRHYGLRITLPRITRLSRSSCALRAAASGIRSKIAGRMPELANRLTVSLTRRRILSGSSS